MFKDIKLLVNKNKIDFEYKIDGNKIVITTLNDINDSDLFICYDENIYDLVFKSSIKYDKIYTDKIRVKVKNKLSFSIRLKDNYYVKSVYKFINGLIDKKTLIEEIELFINSHSRKKMNDDLYKLINEIDNNDKEFGELIIDEQDEHKRIFDLLVNNKTYLSFAKKMNIRELMLLITSFISVPCTPNIDQETFNLLVNEAISYNHSLENVWRISMNYDKKGFNYDLIDSFFVNSEDSWYLGEYICGVDQVDKNKIIDMIIDLKDKKFINDIVEDSYIMEHLDDVLINKLRKGL